MKLADIDPGFKDHHESHKEAAEEIEHDQQKLRALQDLLYADGRCSLLICLQAMDTGGKDGTINHVLGRDEPAGLPRGGFKQPSAEEAAHDFLWRVHRPRRPRGGGHLQPLALRGRAGRPGPQPGPEGGLVAPLRPDQRLRAGLVENDTHILKFFLHISKEEQLNRFEERLDDPAKQWKISEADYKERQSWDDYTAAYEDALSRCSTEHAPWFVIPADHKWFRNLAVARIVVEYLEGLGLTSPRRPSDLDHIRHEYHAAEKG